MSMVIPAKGLVVAPRLPPPPKEGTYYGPWKTDGDVCVDCDVPGCGWHAMGPRRKVGEAARLHHQMYHPDETGVLLLNTPRQ